MLSTLDKSYRYCEDVARREAANFYPAFRILPRDQRRAMCALYAFMRIADDISDGPASLPEKKSRLARWRNDFGRALEGVYSHPSHEALAHTLQTYGVPSIHLEAVLDGVAMDLEPTVFATFADLRLYCYRVASAVGLACLFVWGFTSETALPLAEDAGLAFQLTNILRDLGEDADRGRVYLPLDELQRFSYAPENFSKRVRDDAYRSLMAFQVDRARRLYNSAHGLLLLLRPPGRAVFKVMAGTYRGLLEEIARRDYDVFTRRVRLGSWRKMLLVLGALPARWGW